MSFKKTVQLFLHSPVLFTVPQIGLYIRLFGSIICQKTKRHPDDQHPWHLILQWVLFGQAASRGGNPDHKNGNCRGQWFRIKEKNRTVGINTSFKDTGIEFVDSETLASALTLVNHWVLLMSAAIAYEIARMRWYESWYWERGEEHDEISRSTTRNSFICISVYLVSFSIFEIW